MRGTRKSAWAVAALMMMSLLLVPGCGGSSEPGTGSGNGVSGAVVMAKVTGATVEAFRFLDTGAMRPFSPARTATTTADGGFVVDVGSYAGPVILVATGGTYADEATGNINSLPVDPVLMGMATTVGGTTVTGQLTPLTHWATVTARTLAAEPDTDAALALANAVRMVEDYFGVTGLLAAVPADLTAGAVAAGNAAEHAAAIAGLSQLAADEGFADPMALVGSLALDGADGLFDGRQRGTSTLPSADMGGAKLRDAIVGFLDVNVRNQSGLGSGDVNTDDAVDSRITSGNSAYLWPPRIGTMSMSGGTTAGGTTVTFTGPGIVQRVAGLLRALGGRQRGQQLGSGGRGNLCRQCGRHAHRDAGRRHAARGHRHAGRRRHVPGGRQPEFVPGLLDRPRAAEPGRDGG